MLFHDLFITDEMLGTKEYLYTTEFFSDVYWIAVIRS